MVLAIWVAMEPFRYRKNANMSGPRCMSIAGPFVFVSAPEPDSGI
jgi:hypothetical protein